MLQRPHPPDGGRHIPDLIRVQRDPDVLAHYLPGDPAAPDVVFQPCPHLELNLAEPLLDRGCAQLGQPFIGVAEPAG